MPVTARLSRRFYETFGDDIANELVEWFNRVDDAYRSEFRDLFEVHFARFDAKLEQRLAEMRAETGARMGQLEAKLEQRLAETRAEASARIGQLDAKLEQRVAEVKGDLRAEIAGVRSGLMKWMFILWAGNVVATAGLVFGAVSLLRR
jgi:hypothetical protein